MSKMPLPGCFPTCSSLQRESTRWSPIKIPRETPTFIKINYKGLQIRLKDGPVRKVARAILDFDWVGKEKF